MNAVQEAVEEPIGSPSQDQGEGEAPKRQRGVFVSGKAEVVVVSADGSERKERVNRNIHELAAFLNTLSPDDVVGIYLVEDEEKSEPPAGGEPRYRMPLLPAVPDRDGNMQPSDRLPAVEAMARLLSAVVPDSGMLAQFHSMFDHASATTRLDCGLITLVFNGRPCGFAYVNSCREVPVASLSTLYETALGQMSQLKDGLRQLAPGIAFSDDEGESESESESEGRPLFLPSGARASGDRTVLTPQEAARKDMEEGVTRFVSLG